MSPDPTPKAPTPLQAFEAEFNGLVQEGNAKAARWAISVAHERGVIGAGTQFALIQALRDNLLQSGLLSAEYGIEGFDDLPWIPPKKLDSPPNYDGLARIAKSGEPMAHRHDERVAGFPNGLPEGFFTEFRLPRPRLRVAALRGATVVNSSVTLTTRRTILRETIDFDLPDKALRYLPTRRSAVSVSDAKFHYNIKATPTSVRLVPGAAILLSAERKFFATWMIHLFTRLYVLDYLQRDDLHFIVPSRLWANCIDMVEALGFPRERVIAAEPEELLVCDTLYIPNSPAFEWAYCREEALRPYERLRKRLKAKSKPPHAKLVYISRADGRGKMPTNEPAIARLVESKGFKVLHMGQMSLAEKAAAMNAARVVVCALGSGAFNALLCQPGRVGLVFIGGEHHMNEPAASLAALLDAPVSYVFGAVDAEAAEAAHPGRNTALGMADFDVDLEALGRILDEAVAVQYQRS